MVCLQQIILNSKPEILTTNQDEDEDEFVIVYSRLTGLFRSHVPFTIVFPLAIQLFQKVPAESLEAYRSLSELSCYKSGGDITANWLEEGMQLLKQSTEEQYRVRATETHTEELRRENTHRRQQLADVAMKRYEGTNDQIEISDIEMETCIATAKTEAIHAEKLKWREIQKQRAEMTIKEKERLLTVSSAVHGEIEDVKRHDIGVNFWGIIIGGTAIAGAAIVIAKGYRYI
jgi:hypothetical protein